MSMLPPSVQPDSVNSRQHRGMLANAINGILRKLAALTTADLTDYKAGTWIPLDASPAGLTFTSVEGKWFLIGNLCIANVHLIYPTTSDTNTALVTGLPFAVPNGLSDRQGSLTYDDNTIVSKTVPIGSGSKQFAFYGPAGGSATNANMSGKTVFAQFIYPIS